MTAIPQKIAKLQRWALDLEHSIRIHQWFEEQTGVKPDGVRFKMTRTGYSHFTLTAFDRGDSGASHEVRVPVRMPRKLTAPPYAKGRELGNLHASTRDIIAEVIGL